MNHQQYALAAVMAASFIATMAGGAVAIFAGVTSARQAKARREGERLASQDWLRRWYSK